MLLSPSAQRECVDFSIDTSAAKPQATGVYDGVVVGLAPSLLDYEHLNAAFRILIGEYDKQKSTLARTPLLIALHKAKYLQGTDHALSLGPGPFVSALEEATSTRALIVGKPTKLFFETVISGFGDKIAEKDSGGIGDRQRCVIAIIGDDISTDLGEGAIELGLWRVLVKTGKYRSGDEVRKGVHPPDEICQSFAEFVDQLLSASTSSRVGREMNTA
ncbi:hypothetical protein ID866_4751 [Astraeus odoratus]|nr:hypothetical protein ID866_4751 [Astraeus odoratus]